MYVAFVAGVVMLPDIQVTWYNYHPSQRGAYITFVINNPQKYTKKQFLVTPHIRKSKEQVIFSQVGVWNKAFQYFTMSKIFYKPSPVLDDYDTRLY